ncbi:hypothetical protein PLICRDRAFT_127214 [Plicaturopsis crispa FD-325 SS-3]|uniref:Uncharacterized protein n=1 Tax=Plicaturopsis crispa FD-325 SS-3 TaxID=944288 RepID=A0A0C9T3B4_PLICR|nr:hypothetical protein PLICRDRAFT_127214 [Plicaturopsis crispa FD-325 SS-3]
MLYSMTIYGGYLLTLPQTAQFARLKYPDNPAATEPYLLPRLLALEKYTTDYNTRFMIIGMERVTHDTTQTPYGCRKFRETEVCRKMKRKLFGGFEERLPWVRDLKWETVPDPRMEVMREVKAWRQQRDFERAQALLLQSAPPEDGASERPAQDENNDRLSQSSSQEDDISKRPAQDTNDQPSEHEHEQPLDDEQSTPRASTQPLPL